MVDKDYILGEIKKQAQLNGGRPIGIKKFCEATGIKENQVLGTYWTKWNDAVKEAGLTPNNMSVSYPEVVLINRMALFIRELGKLPTKVEIRHKAFLDATFPGISAYYSTYFSAFDMAKKISDFCSANPEWADVAAICNKVYQDGLQEDRDYAEEMKDFKSFVICERICPGEYIFYTSEKPVSVNQLKTEGIEIFHQIPCNSPSVALAKIRKEFASFKDNITYRYKLSRTELKTLKKFRVIRETYL